MNRYFYPALTHTHGFCAFMAGKSDRNEWILKLTWALLLVTSGSPGGPLRRHESIIRTGSLGQCSKGQAFKREWAGHAGGWLNTLSCSFIHIDIYSYIYTYQVRYHGGRHEHIKMGAYDNAVVSQTAAGCGHDITLWGGSSTSSSTFLLTVRYSRSSFSRACSITLLAVLSGITQAASTSVHTQDHGQDTRRQVDR